MTIESMKKTKFSQRTYAEWQLAAEEGLKGKPFEELKTLTTEGIILEPLYTKNMLDRLSAALPVQAEAVRNGKQKPGWLVAQEIAADSPADFLAKAKDDVARGNDMIVYASFKKMDWQDHELKELASLITEHPIYFKLTQENRDILRVFEWVESARMENVRGVIFSEEPVDAPVNVRTERIDLLPVHNSGGTIIHELGVALSMLAEKMDAEDFAGTAGRLWVRFAVDTHFFQEIAKLRAFRILWSAFCSAYGQEAPAIPIFTETSVRSYSKLDPYVNLLRAGNATFSAVLGGTDAHTVLPHDFLTNPDPISRRIARNIQLVIKEETHVSHTLDASAGSYFIETLTKEYVDAAWQYFLEIEGAGGYSVVMKSGWLTDDIQVKWLQREKEVSTRKASLIGTNIYANPLEPIKDQEIEYSHLEYATAKRLAAPFEKLRAKSKETLLKTAVLHLGPLKDVKRQSDFVTGFLAVGGIEPLISPELQSADSINRFLAEHDIDYAVLCGPKEKVAEMVPALSTRAAVDIAGKYPAEQLDAWKPYGVWDSIYSGKPITDKLEQILNLGKKAF
ncbi:heterodimeric methylmalonyl-CoA mutase small subunit [Planomicrobium soli]|uniref:Heterodimeric methylmalonyl-CoA mutase small subunit n=1 Tax=Planomicrobium soli TaxID=1176648 RepID=A0A2P8H4J0_9BACL|nr:methylmalonyl-CoA mutase family protein [Planomicrobium soli]PSL41113.1 heterodimeric methylmalonyl-CoA mutase small subunit [Planomicrobium soli]